MKPDKILYHSSMNLAGQNKVPVKKIDVPVSLDENCDMMPPEFMDEEDDPRVPFY